MGVRAPGDPKRVGRSYAGFLAGRPPKWQDRLYFEYSMVRALRTRNLKLVMRTKEWPSEMYDLEADPGETRNVYDDAAYRKQRDGLRVELERFFARAGAPPLEDWRSTTRQELTVYSR